MKYTYRGIPGTGPAGKRCHQCLHWEAVSATRHVCALVADHYGQLSAAPIKSAHACNYFTEALPLPAAERLFISSSITGA